MNGQRTASDGRTGEYWRWFAGAMVLLLPADMLTTLIAVSKYGVGGEANPIVRWVLSRGVVFYAALNLAAMAMVVYLFFALVAVFERAEPPHDRILEYLIDVWLGALCAVGIVVVANNVSVILYGESLL